MIARIGRPGDAAQPLGKPAGARQIAACWPRANRAGPQPVRRKIDDQRLARLPIRGNLQHGRPAEAAVSEKQFFPKAARPGRGDDLGGNSRQIGIAREVFRNKGERNQCRPARLQPQAKLLRDLVAERGGA